MCLFISLLCVCLCVYMCGVSAGCLHSFHSRGPPSQQCAAEGWSYRCRCGRQCMDPVLLTWSWIPGLQHGPGHWYGRSVALKAHPYSTFLLEQHLLHNLFSLNLRTLQRESIQYGVKWGQVTSLSHCLHRIKCVSKHIYFCGYFRICVNTIEHLYGSIS